MGRVLLTKRLQVAVREGDDTGDESELLLNVNSYSWRSEYLTADSCQVTSVILLRSVV